MAHQLHSCADQLQRRGFLMRHCSAETRLALAACDWAAEKSQVRVIMQQMSGLSRRRTAPFCQETPDNVFCVRACTVRSTSVLGLSPSCDVMLQGRDIGRLVEMAASLEEAALKEWLCSFSDPREALRSEGLSESMLSDIQRQLSSQPEV